MRLLVSLSDDPRAGLAAGFEDAGQAFWNMELAASCRSRPGFSTRTILRAAVSRLQKDDGEEADGR